MSRPPMIAPSQCASRRSPPVVPLVCALIELSHHEPCWAQSMTAARPCETSPEATAKAARVTCAFPTSFPTASGAAFIGALPPPLRPYASLMRLDRPIGTWLLYWPCAWSVALAGVGGRWDLFLWLALGAFAMRSAGCVYNDIVDRDLDRQVERTRLRPLASGRVSFRSAWLLIALLVSRSASSSCSSSIGLPRSSRWSASRRSPLIPS